MLRGAVDELKWLADNLNDLESMIQGCDDAAACVDRIRANQKLVIMHILMAIRDLEPTKENTAILQEALNDAPNHIYEWENFVHEWQADIIQNLEPI